MAPKSAAQEAPKKVSQKASSPVLDPKLTLAVQRYTDSQRGTGTRTQYRKWLGDFFRYAHITTYEAAMKTRADDVVAYRNSLQARGLAAATINARLAAIRGLFSRSVREGEIPGNPADAELVPGLQVSQESRTEGLSLEEVQKILATCDGTLLGLRDRALLTCLFYQGLRRSEASKLRWRDLTSKRGLLEIRDSKNNPYATIRLRPEVYQAIRDYHEVLNRELERIETRWEDPVFTSLSKLRSFGKKLAPSSINYIVKERVRLAGIKRRISAHSWRHTCTTQALSGGAPLHQVQRHLRHKDLRTTLRYDRERDVRKNPTLDAIPDL